MEGKCTDMISHRIEMDSIIKILIHLEEPKRITNLVDSMRMSHTRVVPIINTLVIFGFIKSQYIPSNLRNKEHRKFSSYVLTNKGREVLKRIQKEKMV